MTAAEAAHRRLSYGALWRWHFYAGLICIPFVIWLAATGLIFLFKPEIDARLDKPFGQVAESSAPRASAIAQIGAGGAGVLPTCSAHLRSSLLPLFGGSLLLILVIESTFLRRWEPARRFLGLARA